jgi:uncharacterized radical SAM superfamily Fe-S cluster-containing enzyme
MHERGVKPFLAQAATPQTLGLPRKADSICPECNRVVVADLYEEDGRVLMAKTCPDHGAFTDVIASRADLFLKQERLSWDDNVRFESVHTDDASKCPEGCGLCPGHLSSPAMTILDLTNRCNLRCPFCFANANVQDYVYEPGLDQLKAMMDQTLDLRPKRLQAIQFSGGEPTLSPHFLEICRHAKTKGFRMIQAATNGIRFGQDPDFAKAAGEAGLNGAYLQFDGIGEEVHRATRGARGLWELKMKALDACRDAGIRVTLVPTVIRGVNDHMVGEVLKFAASRMDAVVGICFQPVSFTGRVDAELRTRQRYTLTDLATDLEAQTGLLNAMEDWYPISAAAPFANLVDNVLGPDRHGFYAMHFNSHPNCSLSALLLVNQRTGQTLPLTRLIDADQAIAAAADIAEKTQGRRRGARLYATARLFATIMRIYRSENAPDGLNPLQLAKTVDAISGNRLLKIAKKKRYDWRLLFISSMHFQDAYNFQVDRVKRCTIQYSTPEGKIYPFCTYNVGANFREGVEQRNSVPKADWVRSRGGKYVTEGFVE